VSRRRLLLLAVVGAALGLGGELLHLQAGVWRLPPGASLPWWVALVYLLLLPLAAWLFRLMELRLGAGPHSSRRGLLIECLGAVVLYLSPALLHSHELLLTALLGLALALRLLRYRAPGDLQLALLAAGIDLAAEASLAAAGLFTYPDSSLGPLPLWLPLFWACLGLSLRRLFLALFPGDGPQVASPP